LTYAVCKQPAPIAYTAITERVI